MKKLIVSLALCISTVCFADEPKEMYMPNDSGGFIALSLFKCVNPDAAGAFSYIAYATEGNGTVHEGCWSMVEAPAEFEPLINVWWAKGLIVNYKQKLFSTEKKRWTDDNNPVTKDPNPIKGDL